MQQVTLDATASGNTTGNSISFSHTVGQGFNRYLLVGVGAEVGTGSAGNLVVTGITFNGVALTKIAGFSHTNGGSEASKTSRTELWYLPGNLMPTAGTYTVVVTFTGTVSAGVAISASYFNVVPGAPESSATTSIATGGGNQTIANNIGTLSSNAMVVDFCDVGDDVSNFTGVGGGQTLDKQVDNPSGGGHAAQLSHDLSGAGTATFTMTDSNNNGETMGQILVSLPFAGMPGGGIL